MGGQGKKGWKGGCVHVRGWRRRSVERLEGGGGVEMSRGRRRLMENRPSEKRWRAEIANQQEFFPLIREGGGGGAGVRHATAKCRAQELNE